MKNQTRKNFLSGIARLATENPEIKRETPKTYCSLHTFLHDYPLPTDPTNREYAHTFYWALLNGVRDADLPFGQRRIRSNLLVEVGIYSGIIKLNRGANL